MDPNQYILLQTNISPRSQGGTFEDDDFSNFPNWAPRSLLLIPVPFTRAGSTSVFGRWEVLRLVLHFVDLVDLAVVTKGTCAEGFLVNIGYVICMNIFWFVHVYYIYIHDIRYDFGWSIPVRHLDCSVTGFQLWTICFGMNHANTCPEKRNKVRMDRAVAQFLQGGPLQVASWVGL